MYFLLSFPLPNLLDELFSSQIITREPLLSLKLLFNNNLSGNTCMITARIEENTLSMHSMPKNETIKQIK